MARLEQKVGLGCIYSSIKYLKFWGWCKVDLGLHGGSIYHFLEDSVSNSRGS